MVNISILSAPVPLPGGPSVPGLEIRELAYQPGASFARHDHKYASLFVMVSGHVREQSCGVTMDCGPGAIGYIPASVEHRSSFGPAEARGLTVTIQDDWLRRCGPGPSVRETGYAQNPLVTAAAMRLYAACRRPDAWRALATEEMILGLVTRATGSDPTRGRRAAPSWLSAVTGLVRERCTEPVGLGDLSAVAGVHPAHLCRTFRAALGCSLTEYAHCARLERACGLLRAGRRDLAGVALEVGFYDQPHFTRAFRRHLGVTPRQFRACFN